MVDIGGTIGIGGLRTTVKDKAGIVKATLAAMLLLVTVPLALYALLVGTGALVSLIPGSLSIPSWVTTGVLLALTGVCAYLGLAGYLRYRTWRRYR